MAYNRWKKWGKPLIGIFLIFSLWFFVSGTGKINTYVLPSPLMVWKAFLKMVASGELFRDIGISLVRVFRGFLIAFIFAFTIGAFRLLLPQQKDFYEHIIQFFRNVPPLSLIPLLILWFGIKETTKTVIIVLASFFPIYLNIVKGFSSVDQKLLEVGKMFQFSKTKSFFLITLPYAMADILVGMRIGLGYAWRAIIAAEMIAASTGLGHMILHAQQTSRTDKVIVGVFVIGIIGYLCDRIFGYLIKTLFRGMVSEDELY